MISGINDSSAAQQLRPSTPPPPPKGQQTSLTDEQTQALQSILEQYDANSLTSENATSIVEQLKSEGIEPGKALESVLSSAGFDAKQIGELAGLGEGKPQRPLPDTATFEVTA